MVRKRVTQFGFIVLMLALSVAPAFAQSTINFDTDELISQSNSWIDTFLPILAIPFGIMIAIALISLVGYLIVKAIKSAGNMSG